MLRSYFKAEENLMSNWLNPTLPLVLALLVIPLIYFVRRSSTSYSYQTHSERTTNSVSYQVSPRPQEWAYELMRGGESVDCNVSFPLRSFEVHSGFVRIVHAIPSDVTTLTVLDDDLLYLRRRSSRRSSRRANGRIHSSEIFIQLKDSTLGWHVNAADPDLGGGMFLGENTNGDDICIIAGKNVKLCKR